MLKIGGSCSCSKLKGVNNVYIGMTSPPMMNVICTFLFQGVHGILISVPYLLCHYTPTIEVYSFQWQMQLNSYTVAGTGGGGGGGGCPCTSDKEAFLYIRLRMTPQYSIDRSQRTVHNSWVTMHALHVK